METKLSRVRGSTFVCSLQGMGVEFRLLDDGRVRADCRLQVGYEGPPHHVHGGALAALIDEAMGAAAWLAGHRVVAAHLSFDYQRAVPLDAGITVMGAVERVEGRKVFTTGSVTLNGFTAVTGSGLFVEAPHFFDDPAFQVTEEVDD